jgi:nitrate reductase NapE component
MESRRTRVTVQRGGDARARAALPIVLVGIAVVAVATAGDGGFGRAHYLRQLVFGPAGPRVARAAPRETVPLIPAGTGAFATRPLARSPVHGHRSRPRRRGVLGPGGLPRRPRQ